MADTVTLGAPVGSGAVVASDDAGAAGQVQIIKLAISADGSATVIPADASVGLRVDPASVAVADGGTLPGKGLQVGGTDGSVFQVMSTDNAGRPNVNINGTVPVSDGGGSLTVDTPQLPTLLASGALGVKRFDDVHLPSAGQLPAALVSGRLDVNVGAALPAGANALGSVTVTGTPAVDTELPAAAALADGAANPTAPAVGGFAMLWNGTTWDRCPGGATNGLTTNLKALNGTTVATNSGNKDAGTQRVVLATDQVQLTNALKVDGSAVTQPVSLAANQSVNNAQVAGTATSVNSGTKDAGTQRVILASDQTVVPISDNAGSLTVDAPLGTPVFTTPTPSTTGGWSQSAFAALTNTKTLIKNGAGTFGGYYTVYNPNASVAYVQIFDAASTGAVTLGTTVADGRITVPAASAANMEVTNGVHMANGIVIACTTTATGSTAPGTGLDGTILYK